MSAHSNSPAIVIVGVLARICTRPRQALREAANLSIGRIVATWSLLLAVSGGCGVGLLSTAVGRQALVDERVRAVEALGGEVDDATYRAWQIHPPYWVYAASGGRTLLLPVVTFAVATLLWLLTRGQGGFRPSLGVAVAASTTLVIQQLVATPLHFVRESLTSPFNLAALLPFFDEGTLLARVFGTIEVFGLWWVVLLAFGCSTLTGHRVRRYLPRLVGTYVGVALIVAGVVALAGGN